MPAVSNDTIDRLANRLFRPKQAEDMPVILARRFTPHPRTYLLFDAGWEGLKKTIRGNKVYWEIDHNFNLRIELDGLCSIPDTPKNRKRLEKCSKPYQVTMDKDPLTGIPYEEPVVMDYPPEYELVEETIIESTVIDQIAKRVLEMQREAEEEAPAPRLAPGPDNRPANQRNRERPELLDDEDLEGHDEGEEEEAEPAPAPRRPAAPRRAKPASKAGKAKSAPRGRPRAPDPLLDPIRDRL